MEIMKTVRPALCCLILSTNLLAAKIAGKVTNGTTNKPAAGDEVVLLSLAGGMQETARTTTNTKGEFSLDIPDEGVQHLLRVSHQRVNYFQPAPQGTTNADVTVYDSAKKVDHLIGEGRVFRVQVADSQQLQVSEMYILRNESQPPRTWMNDRTLEVVLPEGASLQEGLAAGPGGMPVTSAPVPTGVANHYAFIFPIRPGRSQLQVTYKVQYNGSHDFTVSPYLPLAEFGVMLPKGMRFTSAGDAFSPASDESGMTVYVAKSLSPGQQVKFSLAGEGTAPREAQGGSMGASAGGSDASSAAPGGGLGAPTGAPDPLNSVRWFVLSFLVLGLAGGAFWVVRRKSFFGPSPVQPGAIATYPKVSSLFQSKPKSHESQRMVPRNLLLDAVKEELFQLESEHVEGTLSQQDYDAAKKGLDALLRRHIKKTDRAV